MVPIIGPFAREELGTELHVAVLYLVPAGAFGLAGLVGSTRWADRTGRPALILAGASLAGAGAGGLAIAASPLVAMGAACVLALGYGAIVPSSNGLVMDYAGVRFRGTIMGWFMAAEGLGHAAGPATSGLLHSYFDAQTAVAFAAVLFATAAVVACSLAALAGVRLPARPRLVPGLGSARIAE
jgi:AAHS family 4-hydroxybenzoate transporter-like MFS transporter